MLLHDVIQTKKSFSPGSQELNNEAKNGEQVDSYVLSNNVCILCSCAAVCASCLEQQAPA
jgi:hypothetical protein